MRTDEDTEKFLVPTGKVQSLGSLEVIIAAANESLKPRTTATGSRLGVAADPKWALCCIIYSSMSDHEEQGPILVHCHAIARLMENNSICLLCDEEPFLASPLPSPRLFSAQISYALSSSQPVADGVELENFLLDLLQREHIYLPSHGYHERLHQTSHLPVARTRAIQYIVSVCSRLNLGAGTTFNAVNYLDRFISMNYSVKWEDWMMELLSIACLSIASKMDEVSVPSLLDLQMEDLDHSFESITIQQMELTVLRKLDWRLSSITPYSYVEAWTWGSDHVRTRVMELLVGALLDSRFLQFNASDVAASALKAVGEGGGGSPFVPFVQAHGTISKVAECQRMMEELSGRFRFDSVAMTNENGAPMWVPPFGMNQRGKKRKRDAQL